MTVWTYIAQVVNFLIFVAILYLLLYKPVRRIMKQRKDEMEADLREAEKKREEAEKIRAKAEKRAQELEQKRDAILKEARDQAEEQRRELLKQTEELARDRLERFRRIMEQERSELLEKITDQLRETIVQVAGAALSDASVTLAERGIERVEDLLSGMSQDDLGSARKALEESGYRAQVRSAGPLGAEQQDRLKKTLAGKLGSEKIELDVEEDPSLLAGLEVTLGHVNLTAHWRAAVDEALKQSASSDQLGDDES